MNKIKVMKNPEKKSHGTNIKLVKIEKKVIY